MALIKKSITVTDRQQQWIRAQVASGEYGSDSEYFRDLIRRDQEQDARFRALKGVAARRVSNTHDPLAASGGTNASSATPTDRRSLQVDACADGACFVRAASPDDEVRYHRIYSYHTKWRR